MKCEFEKVDILALGAVLRVALWASPSGEQHRCIGKDRISRRLKVKYAAQKRARRHDR